jgi:ribosomal protein L15
MSYNNNKNKSSQSSRGARGRGGRGRGRGRGRGGRGGNRRNRNFKKQKPQCAPKYNGPLIGSAAYHGLHNQITHINFDDATPVPREFMPITVKPTNSDDKYILYLQQEMMDNGWQLNSEFVSEKEDEKHYFTHPTYNGETFITYTKTLSNGNQVYLPLVPRDEDPKGLGCTYVLTAGSAYGQLETNRWHSFWDDRKGRRRANYIDYSDRRQEKRKQYVEMAKTDKSIKVWDKDTPRCDPTTWAYNNSSLKYSTDIY